MLLKVHDELVFEIATGERQALEELVRDKMGHAVELAVPLDVSVGVGRSWHDAALNLRLTLFVAQRYAFLSLWPARLQTE